MEGDEGIPNRARHLVDISRVRPVRIMYRSERQSLFLNQRVSFQIPQRKKAHIHDTRARSTSYVLRPNYE